MHILVVIAFSRPIQFGVPEFLGSGSCRLQHSAVLPRRHHYLRLNVEIADRF